MACPVIRSGIWIGFFVARFQLVAEFLLQELADFLGVDVLPDRFEFVTGGGIELVD